MAASSSQPLLDTNPKRKTFSFRTLYIFVALAAIVCSIWLFTNGNYNTFVSMKSPNICEHAAADQQSSCLAVVSEVLATPRLSMTSGKTNHKVAILQLILGKTSSQIRETRKLISSVRARINNDDKRARAALAVCSELMDMSRDKITDSVMALGNLTYSNFHDAHTWLSAVLTNHDTCMDELRGGQSTSTITSIEPMLKDLMSRASASLALMVSIGPEYLHRDNKPLEGDFPSWLSPEDMELLLEDSAMNINANVVVAKDGSGKYKTVKQAVDSAPTNNKNSRYVIYIKKGTYKENIVIASNKLNLMLVGDGFDDTIITGNLNYAAGTGTFDTPTLACNADGFILQNLGIKNTAGPKGEQAVALRVTGDKSVINRCKIDAFQDTLYAHNQRQFYKDCYITGTVDFIFGNAAVVLQKCKIAARKPGANQSNMVTAQGKTDKNQNTGTTIQDCSVIPSSDLAPVKGSFKSFLGRPWKQYSTTVYIKALIEDHIDPAGWAPWSGSDYLDTLYYGEYQNYGSGAATSKRVKWKGYRVITKASEAKKFTVSQMLGGGSWIKDAGVSFTSEL